MATLFSTTHRIRSYDWPNGSGRILRCGTLWENPGTYASAYRHISLGASQTRDLVASNPKQHFFGLPLQLVHRFFQKYEPRLPGNYVVLLLVVPAVVPGVFLQCA